MASPDLTPAHRRVLRALVDTFQSTRSPVTSADLAAAVDRTPATVRTRMLTLVDLGLVESQPGPKGGYEPTDRAFDRLDRADTDTRRVVLAHGSDRVDVVVDAITFTNVHDPASCRARVRFRGTVDLDYGDAVVVGPTPGTALVVAGTVETVDEAEGILYLAVTRLEAPLTPDD